MRYAKIEKCDYTNGTGIGVSLFVQGCEQRCKGCFNKDTWDLNGGKEWTKEVEDKFLELVSQPFVTRVSLLGGDPLLYNNLSCVYDLIKKIKEKYPDKKIWLWTGYKLEEKDFNQTVDVILDNKLLRNYILGMCDYVIDGAYIDELRDISLKFRGSSNQRIIDVKETIKRKEIVLYD